jgi:hypothetical protein
MPNDIGAILKALTLVICIDGHERHYRWLGLNGIWLWILKKHRKRTLSKLYGKTYIPPTRTTFPIYLVWAGYESNKERMGYATDAC